jgi:hypothetical protein
VKYLRILIYWSKGISTSVGKTSMLAIFSDFFIMDLSNILRLSTLLVKIAITLSRHSRSAEWRAGAARQSSYPTRKPSNSRPPPVQLPASLLPGQVGLVGRTTEMGSQGKAAAVQKTLEKLDRDSWGR